MFPIDMDNFVAADANALQVCYDRFREAEIFVGIYAHRYGYSPTENETYRDKDGNLRCGDGKTSITEWEYRWAIELGIPCQLYRLGKKDRNDRLTAWPIEYVDDDPNRTRFQAFKDGIGTRHVLKFFFAEPSYLAAQVTPCLAHEKARIERETLPTIDAGKAAAQAEHRPAFEARHARRSLSSSLMPPLSAACWRCG